MVQQVTKRVKYSFKWREIIIAIVSSFKIFFKLKLTYFHEWNFKISTISFPFTLPSYWHNMYLAVHFPRLWPVAILITFAIVYRSINYCTRVQSFIMSEIWIKLYDSVSFCAIPINRWTGTSYILLDEPDSIVLLHQLRHWNRQKFSPLYRLRIILSELIFFLV